MPEIQDQSPLPIQASRVAYVGAGREDRRHCPKCGTSVPRDLSKKGKTRCPKCGTVIKE